jgi:hypothetical protein
LNKTTCNVCGIEVDEYLITGFNHKLDYGTCFDGDTLDLKMCPACTEKLIKKLIGLCKINPLQKQEEINECGFRCLFVNNEIIPLI